MNKFCDDLLEGHDKIVMYTQIFFCEPNPNNKKISQPFKS